MIDWHRVRELHEDVGPNDFREVVALFLEEVEEVISRLSASPIPENFEEDFHFLKGAALNLGFDSFAAICAQAERSAAIGDIKAIAPEEAINCYAVSKAQFIGHMEKRVA